jgi:hypothetical protein
MTGDAHLSAAPGRAGLHRSMHPSASIKGVDALVAISRPQASAAGPVNILVRTGPCLP